MSRIVPFLLGAVVGGAGVFYWLGTGLDSADGHTHDAVAASKPGAASVAAEAGRIEPDTASEPATTAVAAATATAAPTATATATTTAVASETSTAAETIRPDALLMPVLGVSAAQLNDSYTQSRGEGRIHDAIDIMAERGTPVVAVDNGKVAKLFDSKPGGLTLYQFDRQEKIAYYYAHLDSYAPGIVEGRELKRGEVLGYVGSTGNASPDAPHLHFAIFVLGPEKYWWRGTAINPFPLLGGGSVQTP